LLFIVYVLSWGIGR